VNTWASDGVAVQTNPNGGAFTDSANWRITNSTTTLADTNQVNQASTTYDSYTVTYPYGPSGITYTISRANPLETREYDYGSGAAGPLLRRTTFAYLHDSNSTYLNKHILDRLTSKIVYDSTANTCKGVAQPCAQTTLSYDTTTITATSGVVQHDYTNFSSTMTVRGNVTLIKNWRNTDGAWLTTTKYYDDLGNLKQTQDPLGHNTFYDYTDSFSGTGNVCVPTGGTTQAFITKITNHLNQFSRYSYYSCSSWFASAIDLNNQTTSFTYDLLNRQVQTTFPDGGQTTNCYTDVGGSICSQAALPIQVVTKGLATPSPDIITTAVFDGLGRVTQTSTSDPSGADYIDTTYDALSRVSTVSNPHRTHSAASSRLFRRTAAPVPTMWLLLTPAIASLSQTKQVRLASLAPTASVASPKLLRTLLDSPSKPTMVMTLLGIFSASLKKAQTRVRTAAAPPFLRRGVPAPSRTIRSLSSSAPQIQNPAPSPTRTTTLAMSPAGLLPPPTKPAPPLSQQPMPTTL
jgi:hypothetical protein